MPQLPIPQDWNETDWLCLQVQWPDSIEYRALLAGFLSYLTRGRAYDAGTGNIKAAQAIGWEIFDKNMPMIPCEGTPPIMPSPGDEPCWRCYEEMNTDESEDDMGCYISDIKCENGQLWVYRCGKWELVESCDTLTTPPPTDDDDGVKEPEAPTTEEDWRCSKATIIVDAIFKVAQAELDHYNEVGLFVRSVESDSGINCNEWQLYNNQLFLLASLVVMEDFQEALSAEHKQDLICKLSQRLDGSNNDIGENQWSIIGKEILAEWIASPLEFTFISGAKEAIGMQTMRSLTRTGVYLVSGNCCPPDSELPADVEWSHAIDFSEETEHYDWNFNGTGVQHVHGTGVVVQPAAYGDRLAGMQKNFPTPAAEGFTVTYVKIEFSEWPAGTGTVSYWLKLGADVVSNDVGLWGAMAVEIFTNRHVSQGQPFEICWTSTLGNPPTGQHVLKRIVYAGTGNDPFPTDPEYTQ